MRVVIAPDSFKECLPAAAVAKALADGWRRVFPEADIACVPMADGGEGTVDALVAATGGRPVTVSVTGPLGDPLDATYGLLGDGRTAVIEMAAASGLALAPPEARNPAVATTYGTGELMRHALDTGAERMIVGIGGSATNDGGAGMAQALGFSLLDAHGAALPPGGAALASLARIDASGRHPALDACDVRVGCDVDNPLCGPEGASHVYAPQKGAAPETVERLDVALHHFAAQIEAQRGVRVIDVPGAGAAGGLGAGLLAFAGAQLEAGVPLIAEACGLAGRIAGADLLLTGEGRLDAQSAYGKTPVGVARIAKAQGVPVIAVAGALAPGYEAVYACGIDAAYSCCAAPMPVSQAVAHAPQYLRDVAEALARTWKGATADG